MKTPEQWMEDFKPNAWFAIGLEPILTEDRIAEIQHDAIAHEHGRFTEATLATPGWYFWFPAKESIHNPQFIRIRPEQIENRYLKHVIVAGTYIGPVEPPKL